MTYRGFNSPELVIIDAVEYTGDICLAIAQNLLVFPDVVSVFVFVTLFVIVFIIMFFGTYVLVLVVIVGGAVWE